MTISDRLFAPAERLTANLCDPARRERSILGVLFGFVAIWTLYGVLAKGSQDVHLDMAELADLARHPALGDAKNPPFATWVTAAWLALFPRADWSFYLLSMVSTAVGLWAAWALFARLLAPEKRVLALALLTLIPLLTFQALKFNNNALMIPVWALTTLFFLRSYEERKAGPAALAGLFGAFAMLTKYWSVFLIAGMAVAALADSRRAAYFRSPASWISAAVGAVVLAPHIAWLYLHHFPLFGYALAVHGGRSLAQAFAAVGIYLCGMFGYVAVPLIVVAALKPSRTALTEMLSPSDKLYMLGFLFWTPLLLPVTVAVLARTQIVALWTMPAWTLMPVLLLAPTALTVTPKEVARVVALAVAVPVVATLAAPAIAYVINRDGGAGPGHYYRLLARAVERNWRQATQAPLRDIGGDLAYGVAFYTRDGATGFSLFNRQLTPWVTDAALARDGAALVCAAEDKSCIAAANNFAGNAARFLRSEVTLTRRYLGASGPSRRFIIIVVPPQHALAQAE